MPRKRRTSGPHENSDNVAKLNSSESLSPRETKILSALEQKHKLAIMFQDVSDICEALIAKAKTDPASVRASLLKEIVATLKSLRDIVEFSAGVEKELAQADAIAEAGDGMTQEERQQVEELQAYCEDINSAWKGGLE